MRFSVSRPGVRMSRAGRSLGALTLAGAVIGAAGLHVYAQAAAPILALASNKNSVVFGQNPIGTTATQVFTLRNAGGGTITLTGLSVTSGTDFAPASPMPATANPLCASGVTLGLP